MFAAMTPLLIALVYILVSLTATRNKEVTDQAFQDGRLATLEIQRILTGFESVLVTLSSAPAVRQLETDRCALLLAETNRRVAGIETLGFIDKDGVIRCRHDGQGLGVIVKDRSYFQEALQTHRLVIGTYLESRVTGKKTLPIALRVMDKERTVLGVMALSIDLKWLQSRLAERSYAPEASITVADKEGVIIARYPHPERFVGTPIPGTYKHLVDAGKPGVIEVTSQDGTERILAYFPVSAVPTGLYVSTGVSTDRAFAPVRSASTAAVVAAVAATVLTLFLSWQTSHAAIGVPLARITDTLDRWQQGDHKQRTNMSAETELGQIGFAIDNFIDRLEEARRQQELLVGELSHRVKNILAVVTSVARQTFETGALGQEKFSARLAAMATAFDLLANGSGQSASLKDLVLATIQPFGDLARFKIDGDGCRVDPKAALAFTMAVHELCTNAVKYGSLSVHQGWVSIAWKSGADDKLKFVWAEHDGPAVQSPSRKGFGTSMIERVWAAQVGGQVTTHYEVSGFRCEVIVETAATH